MCRTGGQQHTFSRRGIGLCASGDHANGVENLIDFGNRSNFPRRSFFARGELANAPLEAITRRTTPRKKMNGVENLGRFGSRNFPELSTKQLTIVENLVAPRGNLHTKFHRPRRSNPPRESERRGKLDRYGQIFHAVPQKRCVGDGAPCWLINGTAWKF